MDVGHFHLVSLGTRPNGPRASPSVFLPVQTKASLLNRFVTPGSSRPAAPLSSPLLASHPEPTLNPPSFASTPTAQCSSGRLDQLASSLYPRSLNPSSLKEFPSKSPMQRHSSWGRGCMFQETSGTDVEAWPAGLRTRPCSGRRVQRDGRRRTPRAASAGFAPATPPRVSGASSSLTPADPRRALEGDKPERRPQPVTRETATRWGSRQQFAAVATPSVTCTVPAPEPSPDRAQPISIPCCADPGGWPAEVRGLARSVQLSQSERARALRPRLPSRSPGLALPA